MIALRTDIDSVTNGGDNPLTAVVPHPPDEAAAAAPASIVLSESARLSLLDHVPAAVFVIDSEANVRFANQRTAEMLGIERTQLFGRTVLDFVVVEDLDFVAELFNAGNGYGNQLMGPSRLRYVDAAGHTHWTQVWATVAPPEMGVDGFIVTLTSESVRDVLATAVTSVAENDELDRTLSAVAMSARAMPLCGQGVILIVQPDVSDDAPRFRTVGHWPVDQRLVDAAGTPWRRAVTERVDIDVDVLDEIVLTPLMEESCAAIGAVALFVRLIQDADGGVIGVFVVFRNDVGVASVNQDRHLVDVVRLASIAFAQAERHLELQAAAHVDALTGAPNRAAFNERLDTERRHVDALFVDLDHFKSVNDRYGHDAGDEVVSAAAARIADAVRRGDVVYRTGGDEFVVVCDTLASPEERSTLAQRIVDHLTEPFDVGDHQVNIGATVGIACGRGRDLPATVRAADAAMYQAKAGGRGAWAHAEPAA